MDQLLLARFSLNVLDRNLNTFKCIATQVLGRKFFFKLFIFKKYYKVNGIFKHLSFNYLSLKSTRKIPLANIFQSHIWKIQLLISY